MAQFMARADRTEAASSAAAMSSQREQSNFMAETREARTADREARTAERAADLSSFQGGISGIHDLMAQFTRAVGSNFVLPGHESSGPDRHNRGNSRRHSILDPRRLSEENDALEINRQSLRNEITDEQNVEYIGKDNEHSENEEGGIMQQMDAAEHQTQTRVSRSRTKNKRSRRHRKD
jgi:hypothetical protein